MSKLSEKLSEIFGAVKLPKKYSEKEKTREYYENKHLRNKPKKTK